MGEYINKLFELINNTVITSNEGGLFSYDDGVECIISCVKKHILAKSSTYFIGNGGSAAIASHYTADYMKTLGMRTHNMYDSSVITCMGNDYGYEYVFSKPLETLGQNGDLLVAVSSSGKSPNIVRAVKTAKSMDMEVITFTGFLPDNPVRSLGDLNIYVPCSSYGKIESIHNLILQQVVDGCNF